MAIAIGRLESMQAGRTQAKAVHDFHESIASMSAAWSRMVEAEVDILAIPQRQSLSRIFRSMSDVLGA